MSNFSQELIETGIVNDLKCFLSWEEKKEINLELEKICFFLDGEEDCVSFSKNDIFIFNINSLKIKQKIKIHNDQILDIVKLTRNRICSCSKDGSIQILEIIENNNKYEIKNKLQLYNDYAIQILFSSKENILFYNNSNNFIFYYLRDNKYIKDDDKFFHEVEGKILLMRQLIDDKIMYITENPGGNKLIKFIDLDKKRKERDFIGIEEKNKKLKVIDLLIFYDYIIIGYDYRVDVIYYIQKPFEIKSFEYFDFLITNIIVLNSNRIILGLYDSEKKESIIREQLLRIEDLQNNRDKFESIGCGNLEKGKIENILKINESQVLINVKDSSCIIFERKNKIGEKFQKKLMNENNNINNITNNNNDETIITKGINEENENKNINIITKNKEELNTIQQKNSEEKSNYNNLETIKEKNKEIKINISNQIPNVIQNYNNNSLYYSYNNNYNNYKYNNINYPQNNNINNSYNGINNYNNVNNNYNNNQFYNINNINGSNNNLYKGRRYTAPNNNYNSNNNFSYGNNNYRKLSSQCININKIDNNIFEEEKLYENPKETKLESEKDNLYSFLPEANKEKLEDNKNKNSYLGSSVFSCETNI